MCTTIRGISIKTTDELLGDMLSEKSLSTSSAAGNDSVNIGRLWRPNVNAKRGVSEVDVQGKTFLLESCFERAIDTQDSTYLHRLQIPWDRGTSTHSALTP